jgi:hypothetical protein
MNHHQPVEETGQIYSREQHRKDVRIRGTAIDPIKMTPGGQQAKEHIYRSN